VRGGDVEGHNDDDEDDHDDEDEDDNGYGIADRALGREACAGSYWLGPRSSCYGRGMYW
jgi:hypothetical protein